MNKYDKIINLPHHVSRNHPQMSMYQRAAQFAPFAALNGHGAAIMETARLTDSEVELSEYVKHVLDSKFNYLLAKISEQPLVSITYFVHDLRKVGGKYTTHTGVVKKWDEYKRTLLFDDDLQISISQIIDIEFPS